MRSLRLIRLQKAYRHSSRGNPIRDRRSGYHWSRSNWKREDGGVQFAYLAEFMGEATAVLRTCSSSDAVRRPHSRLDQMLTVRSELAYQISQQVTSLGSPLGVRTAVLVGGLDMMSQSIALSKRPHVLVATPGRLMDHLENTKGFSLKGLKYLVSLPVGCGDTMLI